MPIRSTLSIVVLGLSLMAFAPAAGLDVPSVATGAVTVAAAAVSTQDSVPAQVDASRGSALPERAPEPRTMRAYWPIFALFAASWVGIMVYLVLIGRHARRIGQSVQQRELER